MDVFTTELYRGNPAAVVFDAAGLTADAMQAIAGEMNLSETAFGLAPTAPSARYRVGFFTPRSELPFAGHPTIAVAAALKSRHKRSAKLVPERCAKSAGLGLFPWKPVTPKTADASLQ